MSQYFFLPSLYCWEGIWWSPLCQQCLMSFTTPLRHSLCFSLSQCCTNCRRRTDEGWSNQGEEDIKARAVHDEVEDQSQGKNYRVLDSFFGGWKLVQAAILGIFWIFWVHAAIPWIFWVHKPWGVKNGIHSKPYFPLSNLGNQVNSTPSFWWDSHDLTFSLLFLSPTPWLTVTNDSYERLQVWRILGIPWRVTGSLASSRP